MISGRKEFDSTGYLELTGVLSDSLCQGVRDARTRAWTRDLATNDIGSWTPLTSGGRTVPAGGCPLDRLDPGAVLRLIGSPAVLSAVRPIAGEDAIPAIVWSLQKHCGDGHEIRWHQDTVYDRAYRVVTVGYHIDPVGASERLCVVPGTQAAAQDMDRLEELIAERNVPVVSLEAGAGDVLIHDSMLVHGSAARTEPGARLSIYVEFRSAAHVRDTESGMDDWIEARRALLTLAERLAADRRDPSEEERRVVAHAAELRRNGGVRNQSFREPATPIGLS